MHYRVKVMIENVATGLFRESERVVQLSAGQYDERHPISPGGDRPIDTNQQARLVRWAINEAADEVIGNKP